jgi:NOL1/NOP2/fmu family ribosome biogenesis protein
MIKDWEQYGVDYYKEIQRKILPYAVKMLKPGGYLLYSTCTFSPEENEGTITNLHEQFPEMEVVPAIPDSVSAELFGTLSKEDQDRLTAMKAREDVSYEGFAFGRPEWANGEEYLKQCIRLWPHKLEGEGHFVALLRKTGGNELSPPAYVVPAKEQKLISEEAKEFFASIRFPIDLARITVREDRLYLLPEGIADLKGLRVLRSGLLLGEMKKNRFEPSQALASSLKMTEYDNVYNLKIDDEDVIRYLKCESIDIKQECKDGWLLICVEGFPLGFGKYNKGNFKNKFYPGWRWM